jgi:hypothetical protein
MASEKLKKYLISIKDNVCQTIEDIYVLQKQNDFWQIVQDSKINTARLSGNFHIRVVELFGDVLPNHEDDDKISIFFSKLSKDCCGNEVFAEASREIVQLLQSHTSFESCTRGETIPSSNHQTARSGPASQEEVLVSTVWSDPQMRQKVVHMSNIVSTLNKKNINEICTTALPNITECQLHTDSIGLAKGASYYDKYTSDALFLIDELNKIKQGLRYIYNKLLHNEILPNLKVDLDFFCRRAKQHLFSTNSAEQNAKDEDILNKTKDILKGKVENQEIKDAIEDCFDILSTFLRGYSSLPGENLPVKKLWCLPTLIQRIQDELLTLVHCNSESLWLAIDAHRELLKHSVYHPLTKIDEIKPATTKGEEFVKLWGIAGG